ncbi:MAG: signal peptidase I [Planctomycetales bacterium 4572_13]|nr:MAG: signal peptidase I [Planctomycetales bacterium 4572_13]
MFHASKDNLITSGHKHIDAAYHNAEWLITAFASTLVFIIFVMQVYRIPTGSMAETLRGAHFRVRCGQCGFRYDHDFISQRYGMKNTANPAKKMPIGPRSSRCPSCGYSEPKPIRTHDGQYFVYKDGKSIPAYARTVFKGDQIFVLKSVYQFFNPKRWDVIVFKNPTEPRINYIKRCIGLPGEELAIIDGDIFINGHIQRKPKKVQEELWMTIYDNDYHPARPDEASFNGHSWKQPFENVETSKWRLSATDSAIFELDSDDEGIHRIQYNDQQGNDFRATYAYDDPGSFSVMPVCSDLMVQYYPTMQADSVAGAQIRKYGTAYQGWVRADGTMRVGRQVANGRFVSLKEGQCSQDEIGKLSRFRFAVVDQQLVLEFGSSRIVHDLGTDIDAAGTDREIMPQVQILGRGKVQLTHIGLYRDIYYLSSDEDKRVQRASRENSMILTDNEFFVCGDNSPFSADSRMWKEPGLANNAKSYPAGVVPKDYLVGKAFFVHWPGGYRLKEEPIRWIPFPDGMKPIYGGKD